MAKICFIRRLLLVMCFVSGLFGNNVLCALLSMKLFTVSYLYSQQCKFSLYHLTTLWDMFRSPVKIQIINSLPISSELKVWGENTMGILFEIFSTRSSRLKSYYQLVKKAL